MNNTPLVVMLIPVTVALAKSLEMSASRLLMPLSFAAIIGGTCTLVGTSTNLLVDGVAVDAGLAPFGLFEITPVGTFLALGAGLYLAIVARFLLPSRTTTAALLSEKKRPGYLVQFLIPRGSPLIGSRPDQLGLFNGPDQRVVDVLRGELSLRRSMADVVLAAGDIVVLKSTGSSFH